jgi:cell division protein FtsW
MSDERPARREPKTKPTQPIEHRLLSTATLCLLAGGAVMVYRASSARTVLEGQGDGTGYLVKYIGYGAIGLLVMHLLSKRGLDTVRRFTPLLLLGAFVLTALVLVPGIGVEVNGARRWLGAGPIQFQPSEILKLALILHACSVIAAKPKIAKDLRLLAGPVIGVAGAGLMLILLQPDLGTALVISLALAALLIAAGAPMRQIVGLAACGAVLVLIYAFMEEYRRARLTAFLHPADAGPAGYQSLQGQIAIGSGGFLGTGLGASTQKVNYLPEAHTDFILAVIGEEIGFVGIGCLLALYGMIGYAGLRTAKRASGLYAKLLASGLTSLILCQALLNVYAVLGLAPLTGVPLPFISSGSTSLIVLLCSMGLLLNVAGGGTSAHLTAVRRRERPAEQDPDRGRGDRRPRRPGDRRGRRAAG